MMNFVLQIPSLQHLAGVKIATHLWNQRDIFTDFETMLVDDLSADASEWLRIKDVVKSKVSALPMPKLWKKYLTNLINELGNEIMSWCHYHSEQTDGIQVLDVLAPAQLRWRMHGTVDYKKTAELMVKDESLDPQKRFELACIHCFEDEARELFQTLTRDRNRVPISRYANRFDLSHLILFFTRSIHLEVDETTLLPGETPVSKHLFENTLPTGNEAMCKYLFQRLKPEEKDQVFQRCRELIDNCRRGSPTRNLLYYFSLMNEEQQRIMFEKHSSRVLMFLLRWPMQSLFVDAAQCGWPFMDNVSRSVVFSFIIMDKINKGSDDYDYSQMYFECWSLSPAEFKLYYLNDLWVLDNLLLTGREEFIRLILMEAPLHQSDRYYEIIKVLMDESVISERALMAYKEEAGLSSSNEEENEEKRSRNENLSRNVDFVLGKKTERRE